MMDWNQGCEPFEIESRFGSVPVYRVRAVNGSVTVLDRVKSVQTIY
jgi:hypothetical protein